MEAMLKGRVCTRGHATNYFWAHKEPLEGILFSPLEGESMAMAFLVCHV